MASEEESGALFSREAANGTGGAGVKVWADVAQLVEHSLGKGEVTSSILVIGSRKSGAGQWKCHEP